MTHRTTQAAGGSTSSTAPSTPVQRGSARRSAQDQSDRATVPPVPAPTTPIRTEHPRRKPGTGSIYYDRGHQCWRGTLDLPITHRRRRTLFAGGTYEEVDQQIEVVLQGKQLGLPVDKQRIQVGQYMEFWLTQIIGTSIAPSTYEVYARQIRVYITPILGQKRLGELTHDHVQAFTNLLGRIKQRRCQGTLSVGTIHHVVSILGSALNEAVRRNYVVRNAAAGVRFPKEKPFVYQLLTPQQTRTLCTAGVAELYGPLYIFMVCSSVRSGEARGTTWSHLTPATSWEDPNLSQVWLDVAQQVRRLDKVETLATTLKSESSRRRLALPLPAIRALQYQRQWQQAICAWAGRPWDPTGLVFTTPKGAILSEGVALYWFKKLLRKLGLPPMRLHDLRHTCATLLVYQHVALPEIQKFLGHGNLNTTLQYLHTLGVDLGDNSLATTAKMNQLLALDPHDPIEE